jgi:hypothetical protein
VGTNWGNAPVQIETVTGTLELPDGRWTCRTLGADGTYNGTANISYQNGIGTLNLQSHFGTMWYLLERSNADTENLALNKTVQASSTQEPGLEEITAVEGDLTPRWSSQYNHPLFILIFLGQTTAFNTIRLHWETAYASKYLLQTSDDNTNWSTLIDEQNGNGGIDEYSVDGNARYLRVYGTERGTSFGYALYEIEVYQCPGFNLDTFVTFASYWLQSDCGLFNQCDGADSDNDNDVDLPDILYLGDLWLSNKCFALN